MGYIYISLSPGYKVQTHDGAKKKKEKKDDNNNIGEKRKGKRKVSRGETGRRVKTLTRGREGRGAERKG